MSGIFHMMFNKIASAIQAAFAVDLDGANDYFSRASDFTGNADGKTFTFSAFFYADTTGTYSLISNNGSRFVVYFGSNFIAVGARDSGGTLILDATCNVTISLKTFNSVIISIDLANTSNRSIYINDIAQSVTWSTYTNSNIDFTQTSWGVGADAGGGGYFKGRLSNVFLAYEYVDLSVEANRRIFITADRKPA